jgi:hypothetical protein
MRKVAIFVIKTMMVVVIVMIFVVCVQRYDNYLSRPGSLWVISGKKKEFLIFINKKGLESPLNILVTKNPK